MRVFASVGTHPQAFDRLLRQLDEIAGKRGNWQIFAQSGNSSYEPKNFQFRKFLQGKEFEERISNAQVVISHGGAGTIISSMLKNKRLVVVPRLKRFKEHTNDHQLDLARALAKEGKAIAVEDIQNLEKAIQSAVSFKPKTGSNKQGLINAVREFIGSG